MKLYIRSNQTDKPVYTTTLNIGITYYLVESEEDTSISASIEYPKDPNIEEEILRTVLDNFEALVATLKNLFKSYGFMYIEETQSNSSKSAYLKFCYESEYDIQEVEIVFTMRISDHRVPMQRRHKTHDEAEQHMEEKTQEYMDINYRWLNKRLLELDDKIAKGEIEAPKVLPNIPLVMSFVTLNNRQCHNRQNLLKRIQQELIGLTNDNPPTV